MCAKRGGFSARVLLGTTSCENRVYYPCFHNEWCPTRRVLKTPPYWHTLRTQFFTTRPKAKRFLANQKNGKPKKSQSLNIPRKNRRPGILNPIKRELGRLAT